MKAKQNKSSQKLSFFASELGLPMITPCRKTSNALEKLRKMKLSIETTSLNKLSKELEMKPLKGS